MRSPDGSVQLDPSGRQNGRGAYVCRDEACITGALGRGGLHRALEATIPAGLADQLMTAASGGGTDGPK